MQGIVPNQPPPLSPPTGQQVTQSHEDSQLIIIEASVTMKQQILVPLHDPLFLFFVRIYTIMIQNYTRVR